jgi:hypothetical protein
VAWLRLVGLNLFPAELRLRAMARTLELARAASRPSLKIATITCVFMCFLIACDLDVDVYDAFKSP